MRIDIVYICRDQQQYNFAPTDGSVDANAAYEDFFNQTNITYMSVY